MNAIFKDNSVECWIEFDNENDESIRLVPDNIGWKDGRKEIQVLNINTGRNISIYFENEAPSEITLMNEEAAEVLRSIPADVLRWALKRAK